MVSWLDARSQRGRWHLRIDDVDQPRTVPDAADEILRTLEAFGLGWDGPVVFQSHQTDAYHEALEWLTARERVFACACSRQDVAAAGVAGLEGPVYPGTCRLGMPHGRKGRSIRLRVDQRYWTVNDRGLGPIGFDLQRLGGDFVIRRADGVVAYQLATVVDDIALGVTDVVRGIDLLGSVPRQMQLHAALEKPPPRYLHHPVVVAANRLKLGKSTGAAAATIKQPAALLARILRTVGVPGIDADYGGRGPSATEDLLAYAAGCWNPQRLPAGPIPESRLENVMSISRGSHR